MYDLDDGKLKTVHVGFLFLVDNEVVKNAKFNTVKTKVNNVDKKIPDAASLIHINQYYTDKKKFREKNRDADEKIPDTWLLPD